MHVRLGAGMLAQSQEPTMVRVPALVAATAVLVLAHPATAQELSPWGGWNDYGHGWQGTKPKRRGGGGYFSPYSYTPPDYRARPEPEDDDFYRPYQRPAFPALMDGGPRPVIEPEAPPLIAFANSEPAGTVLIDTEARRLYFTVNAKQAFEYPISVGREGFTWTGSETKHVVHLASLASVGTTVKVLPRVVGSNAVTRDKLEPLPSALGGAKPRG